MKGLPFDKNSVQACLDQGDFCLQDLCSNEPHALQDLVKCLLLKHCSQQLYGQVSQWVTSKKRASLLRPILRLKFYPLKFVYSSICVQLNRI